MKKLFVLGMAVMAAVLGGCGDVEETITCEHTNGNAIYFLPDDEPETYVSVSAVRIHLGEAFAVLPKFDGETAVVPCAKGDDVVFTMH